MFKTVIYGYIITYYMKINTRTKTQNTTTNYGGAKSFVMSPKSELVQRVITCYWNEPKFYEQGEKTATAIIELIQEVAKKDPEFVLQLAKTIRNDPFNMRTVSVVMWVEAGLNDRVRALRDTEGRSLVALYAPSIIRRADELTEAMAYLIQQVGQIGSNGDGSIPAGIKKGLARAFENFDEYQFAKYRGSGDVKLKDVMKLVRPKPRAIELRGKKFTKKQRSELYKNIISDVLRQDTTWESILSSEGRSAETWNKIIAMGNEVSLMALTRNLRNMMQVGANIDPVLARLQNEKEVLRSKQHSYRYYTAYKMIEQEGNKKSGKIMEALERAIEISAGNLPQLGGSTAVLIDLSGSMSSTLSNESIIQYRDIGCLMGAISHYISDESVVIPFSESAKIVPLSKNNSIISNLEKISRTYNGSSTNTWLAIQKLLDENIKVDRILNFTDMQSYGAREVNAVLNEYRKRINPNVWFYDINLAGYGTCEADPHNPRNINLAGWTPQILNFIQANEGDRDTFIKSVDRVTP